MKRHIVLVIAVSLIAFSYAIAAEKTAVEEKVKEGKIEIINNTNVTEVKGDKSVKSALLDKPFNGKKQGFLKYALHCEFCDILSLCA